MLETVAAVLHQRWQALRDWRERRRTYRELLALDDRTLNDIGLNRAQLPFMTDWTRREPANRNVKAA